MTGPRYAIILPRSSPVSGTSQTRIARIGLQEPFLACLFQNPAALILGNVQAISIGDPPKGTVLGRLFRKEEDRPCTALPPGEAAAILRSKGQWLIDRYWGDYVALLPGTTGEMLILRAPMGYLPAYCQQTDEVCLVASDIALLEQLSGRRATINREALAEHLAAPELGTARTCLSGIRELAGGQCGRWAASHWQEHSLWSPWTHVSSTSRSVVPKDAAVRLRSTVNRTIAARTSAGEHAILLLSGGLDSSIVAAGLSEAGRPFTALTMVTRDRGGDERRYAAMVAARLGIELTDCPRRVEDVAFDRSDAGRLPRPGEHAFHQATRRAAETLAYRKGAGMIVHGGGGDNLFCSVRSVAPLLDYLRVHGLDKGFRNLADSMVHLTQAGLPLLVWHIAKRALFRRSRYRLASNCHFLASKVQQDLGARIDHPWFRFPPRALEGSGAHIGSIALAESLIQNLDILRPIPSWPLLLSQPVVECCVGIPSWLWYDRGHDRALVRHAFADRLPEPVLWRSTKGAMDSFLVELFEASHAHLRTMLLDGLLAGLDLLDRDALHAALATNQPIDGATCNDLLRLADAEAWARSWSMR
ncbi:lasso peptide isopeptide bond-forming cyclase [Stakelama sediminis]